MIKTNVQRLLHTLVPFIMMTMIQRSLLLLFDYVGVTGEAAGFLAFLPAAVCAMLIFRVKTYSADEEDACTETPPLQPKNNVMCVLLTVFTCGVMIFLMYVVAALLGSGVSETPELSVLSVVSILIVHPLLEEILFRKMFYGELRLMNPIFGCIARSLMFAIMHNTVDGMIYALFSGVILAVVYEQSGRIWTSVATHMLINLRSFLCLTVLADSVKIAQSIDVIFMVFSGIAMIALLVMEGRRFVFYQETGEKTENPDEGDDADA